MENHKKAFWVAGTMVVLFVGILMVVFVDGFFGSQLTPGDKTIEALVEESRKLDELYYQHTLRQNIEAFDWHHRSTRVIFWVSMLVTVSGVALSFWQFLEAAKIEKKALGEPASERSNTASPDVKPVSTQGDEIELKNQFGSLAFKARSTAALVLFVSVAYLTLYVSFVYPIKPVQGHANWSTLGEASVEIETDPARHAQLLQDYENVPKK